MLLPIKHIHFPFVHPSFTEKLDTARGRGREGKGEGGREGGRRRQGGGTRCHGG